MAIFFFMFDLTIVHNIIHCLFFFIKKEKKKIHMDYYNKDDPLYRIRLFFFFSFFKGSRDTLEFGRS